MAITPIQKNSLPVILIKADDHGDWNVQGTKALWDYLDTLCRNRSIKLNLLTIGKYYDGDVSHDTFYSEFLSWKNYGHELCNHGSDGIQGIVDIYDTGSAAAQQADLEIGQSGVLATVGVSMIGFGSPNNLENQPDTETALVAAGLKVWFYAPAGVTAATILPIPESAYFNIQDTSGIYGFANAKSWYDSHLSLPCIAFQFHPGAVDSTRIANIIAAIDSIRTAYPTAAIMTVSEYYAHCGGDVSSAGVIYENDFDNGTIGSAALGSAIIQPFASTDSPYAGTHCLKSEINPTVSITDYRSEIELKGIEAANPVDTDELILGKEYWLGFALKAPVGFPDNGFATGSLAGIICQWHNYDGSAYLTPAWHLDLYASNTTTSVKLGMYRACGGVNGQNFLKDISLGVWHEIVVHFKPSLTTSGFFRVYVDGVKLYEVVNTITANSSHPRMFLKMGLYSPQFKTVPGYNRGYGEYIVYQDSIKLADSTGSYASVDPAAGAGPENPPSPSGITSVNSGTNQIAANTEVNTAVTVEINGAVSATISDGTDIETVQAIPATDGLLTYFNTGALTDIGTPATLAISHATPGYKDYNPRAWADNFTATTHYTNYTTEHGPFVLGQTHTVKSGDSTGNRSQVDSGLTATAGDTINARFYVVAGSGNRFRAQVYLDTDGTLGSTTRVVFSSTLGSLTCTENDLADVGTPPTVTQEDSLIYPGVIVIDVQFTIKAGVTSNKVWFGIGTGTATIGDAITTLGAIIWKNRALLSHDIEVSMPALVPTGRDPLTITSVSALTSGSTASVVGTNLDTYIGGVISNGSTSSTINDWVSSSTTSAQFTAPFGLPTGSLTIDATYAPSAVFNNQSDTWSNNTGATLNAYTYPIATWAAPYGLTIESDGAAWHRTSQQMSYVKVGDIVTCEFAYIAGSSNRVSLNVRINDLNLNYSGIIGALPAQPSDPRHGTNISISTEPVDGVIVSTVTFTSTQEGYITMGIGHDSSNEFETVIAFAKTSWTNEANAVESIAVTVVSNQVKKFVWSTATGNAIHCYNSSTNTFTPFTGNMAVTISDGDWFAPGDDVNELAYAPVVAFVNGEAELVEADLTFGSINALLPGNQGYNYWATDGTCRADNAIELTAE